MAQLKPRVVKPSVGIDLGTTYSCVAVFQNGRPEVIANSQGNRITPSVVAFTKEGRLIGEGAEIQRKLDPPNAIYNAKRFIGRTWDDPAVQASHSSYPFKVVERNQKIQFQVENGPKTGNLTPEEIAASILSKMKKIVEDYLEEPVEDVVITVPAYFNDSQRQATINAGKIAGLNVIRIINEPTAAAMAYGLREGTKQEEGKHILVYDLGGGTFDVSVLEIEDDLIQVKSTAGNTNLGGEDFNDILLNHFKQEIIRKHKFDIASNCKVIRRLTGACEKMKRNLSAENVKEAKLELDSFLPNGKDFVASLSRAKFESLCKERFDETIKCVDEALRDAQLNKVDIDQIILVGGSSRIPKLQSMLSGFFNKILNKSINPDEAVACGAAVQAAIINNDPNLKIKDMLLMDVIPLSIGVSTRGGITSVVVERNSTIPVRRTTPLQTSENDQTSVRFRITEGERTMTKDNRILGSFNMYGLPKAKAGEVIFDTEFEVNENGILTVSATMRGTNKKAGITLDPKSSGKLSDKEVKRCIREAERMKLIDQNEENRIMSKNKLTSLCNQISYDSQDLSESDIGDVLKSVKTCLSWINENPHAEENQFISKFNALNDEAKRILKVTARTDNFGKSSHVLRMGKQKANVCMKEGRELQISDNVDDKIKASEYFMKAYKIASEGGSIFKEIEALVCYGQMKRVLSTLVTDCKLKLRHALETVKSLAFVLDIEQNKSLSEDERSTVLKDIQLASEEFFTTIKELDDEKKFCALNALMRSLDNNNAVKNKAFSQIAFECRIKITACLASEDTRQAKVYIQSVNYPKEQAKLLAKTQHERSQLAEIVKTIQEKMCQAEGLHQIDAAINVLDGVEVEHPDTIDKALMALDHLSEAKQLSEGAHVRVYAKANFFEGKIFMDFIPNPSKAKSCFDKVVIASEAKQMNTEEYRQSKYILDQLQKEQIHEKAPSINRETLLKELQEDIQKIKQADDTMSDENFIDFLFSEYPPKHKENYKKPDISSNASAKKKAYIRLSMFYHPDKVDASQHGEKYKALCGEISKSVNGRFMKM